MLFIGTDELSNDSWTNVYTPLGLQADSSAT